MAWALEMSDFRGCPSDAARATNDDATNKSCDVMMHACAMCFALTIFMRIPHKRSFYWTMFITSIISSPASSFSLRVLPRVHELPRCYIVRRAMMTTVNAADGKSTSLAPVPDDYHRVVFMRHGESAFNNANVFTGRLRTVGRCRTVPGPVYRAN